MKSFDLNERGRPARPALSSSNKQKAVVNTTAECLAQRRTPHEVGLAFVATIMGEPTKETWWLPICIEIVAAARAELAGAADMNLDFDIACAERLFVQAIVYKQAEASRRCWETIGWAITRIRLIHHASRRRRWQLQHRKAA